MSPTQWHSPTDMEESVVTQTLRDTLTLLKWEIAPIERGGKSHYSGVKGSSGWVCNELNAENMTAEW